jgi:hypothetical protein
MMYNGVKLYSEADKFDNVAGNLISFCHPPNMERVNAAVSNLRSVIYLLAESCIENVHKNYPNGEPGTEERKRHNWTISEIRRIAKKRTKGLHKEIRSHVWRG